ncbi:hypothetical protein MTR67_015311 [Solanum verrucosum]|uniref:Uncharacterized protein n=1 Tax=Solanum verrucosum TaxID=315347 RepID=A0AAF0QJQ9_SOLVR|nr:hypothetical protein MTR67_015311 [Solanum verrucosum]
MGFADNTSIIQHDTVCVFDALFLHSFLEEKQKSIDIESVCLLLDLVLGSQFRPQVDALIQYLRVSYPMSPLAI